MEKPEAERANRKETRGVKNNRGAGGPKSFAELMPELLGTAELGKENSNPNQVI